MFGYVIADREQLTEEQTIRYKSVYCGICRELKEKGGIWAQLTLTYDMAFAVILLSSLYEPDETVKDTRCYSHLFKKNKYVVSKIIDYAADMNIILAYHNLKDDIYDEGKKAKKIELKFIENSYMAASNRYPLKSEKIANLISELSREEETTGDADTCANIFAKIMQQVFSYKNDIWSDYISDFSAALGRVIYIMDAVDDIETDIKKGSFNPLKKLYNNSSDFKIKSESILQNLLGECVNAFEKLPLENDIEIMRNILCSGIWIKLDSKKQKKDTENERPI